MRLLLAAPLLLIFAGCVGIESEAVPAPTAFAATIHADAVGSWTGNPEALNWDTQDWLEGEMPPVWTIPAFPVDLWLSQLRVNATYTVSQPMLGDDTARPSWTAWMGPAPEWTDHLFVASERAVLPGSHTIQFDARLPGDQLFVPAGTPFQVGIGSYHVRPDGALAIDLAATTLELVGVQSGAPARATFEAPIASGTVQGGRCIAPLDAGDARYTTTIFAAEDSEGVRIDLVPTSQALGSDIDFTIHNAAGDYIAGSHGPQAWESAYTWAHQWGDSRELTIMVFACHPQDAAFDIIATSYTRV